ncbi:Protein YIF1 [Entamoeba marina]
MTTPQQTSQADSIIDNISSNPFANAGLAYAQNFMNQEGSVLKNQLGGILSFDSWRYYFDVSTSYVLKRLAKVLFPYPFFGSWQRVGMVGDDQVKLYNPPIDDEHAPDLYIPLMSYISYVLMIGFITGSMGTFTPETLSVTATACLIAITFEVFLVKLLAYMIFDFSSDFRVYLSYLSLIFVPVIVISFIGSLSTSAIVGMIAYFIFSSSFAFFTYKIFFGALTTEEGDMNKKRIFAIALGIFQFVISFFLMKTMN